MDGVSVTSINFLNNFDVNICPDLVNTYNYLLNFKPVSSATKQYERVFSEVGDVVGSGCFTPRQATNWELHQNVRDEHSCKYTNTNLCLNFTN